MTYTPPSNRPKDKSSRSLTVSANRPAPPVLSATTQLVDQLKVLAEAQGAYSERSLNTLRAMAPEIDKLRARWSKVDQPATYAQITEEMLRLAATMPHSNNIDEKVLVQTLCEDMVELRPSAFALERACRAHRRKAKYLSFNELAKEVEDAETEAKYRWRSVLKRDLHKEIAKREEYLLEKQRAEEEERLREEKEKQRRRHVRQLRKEYLAQNSEGRRRPRGSRRGI